MIQSLTWLKSNAKRYSGELAYTSAGLVQPVVRVSVGLGVALFVSPTQYGVLQTVALIASYVSFLHFGVFNGLNRNLAMYKARGEHKAVQGMVDSSFSVAKTVSIVGFLIGCGVTFYFHLQGRSEIWILSSIATTMTLLVSPFSLHYSTTFRSGQEFQKLGKIMLLQNTLYAVAATTTALFGWVGKLLADVVNSLSGFLLRRKWQPAPAHGKGNLYQKIELAKIGFPLLISGYLLTLFKVADQSVIALQLGTKEVGYYTLARIISMAVPVVPTLLAVMLYPRASAAYGRTGSNKGLRKFYWQSLGINLIVVSAICALLYMFLPLLIEYLVPKYEPGLTAAKISLLTSLTFISSGPSIIIGVVRKNIPYLIAAGLALTGYWAVSLLKPVATLEYYAWLRFYFAAGLSVFTLLYSYYLTTLETFSK